MASLRTSGPQDAGPPPTAVGLATAHQELRLGASGSTCQHGPKPPEFLSPPRTRSSQLTISRSKSSPPPPIPPSTLAVPHSTGCAEAQGWSKLQIWGSWGAQRLSICLRFRARPRGPGIKSASGSLHGACFSLCLCLCLSLCLS